MKCPRCHEHIQDGEHWCIPYANWVAQGMFDFVQYTINTREEYQREDRVPEAVAGFSSCIIMSVTMIAEVSLKTLLAQEGNTPSEFRNWGHDLRNLYDNLKDDTKIKIMKKFDTLSKPYCDWKGPNDLETTLEREKRNFVSWRYLAEGHDGSLTSNPFHLAAVAYAIFSLHVEQTDLPEIVSP